MQTRIAVLALSLLFATPALAQNGPFTGGGPFGSNAPTACKTASTTVSGCVKVDGSTVTISGGVISATGGGGGGSVAIAATTSNVTYRPLFATSTSAAASTVYVDVGSPWSYNASTGLTSILGITTTSFTDNGNAALNGTTTIATARVTGGTINGTTIGATTSSSALFTTVTANAFAISGQGAGYLQATTSGVVTSANLSPRILPLSLTTTDTGGNLFPNTYIGTGGNVSPASPGWGVVASLGSNVVLQGRFLLPHVLPPSGTLNLVSLCQAAAGSGTAKYTTSDAIVNSGSDPSAASLTGETQTSLSITTTGGYLLTATPLTPSPASDGVSVVAITFNTTGWTLAQTLSCNWFEQFQ